MDVDNRVKPAVDLLAHYLKFDDRYVIELHEKKLIAKEEKTKGFILAYPLSAFYDSSDKETAVAEASHFPQSA